MISEHLVLKNMYFGKEVGNMKTELCVLGTFRAIFVLNVSYQY